MALVVNKPAGPGGKVLNVAALHAAVLTRLGQSYKNVALSTFFKTDHVADGREGHARKKQDPPETEMSAVVRTMNCASNSKVITAAAVLRQLWVSANASLSTPMHRFLPSHWTVHPDVKKITFEHLLAYRSGLSKASTTYEAMKDALRSKPPAAPGVRVYKNIDYGLFRLLLPGLAGYRFDSVTHNLFGQENRYLSLKHRDLVRKLVFDRIGIHADLESADQTEMLRYDTWNSTTKGKGSSSQLLKAGSTGWFLDCRELGHFYSRLWHTKRVLPKWLRIKMFDDVLGYDSTGKVSGVGFATKGGRSHSGQWAYFSRFVGFQNGVIMVVYSNSGLRSGHVSATTIIKEEFATWYV